MMKLNFSAIAVAVLLSGCAAGPDFVHPAAPSVARYTVEPLTGDSGAQRLVAGQDVPSRWWTLFGSDELNALVDAALAANPDLQAAEAGLRAARELAAAQRGAYAPSVDLQLTPSRQQVADSLSSPTASGTNLYTLHTAQLNIGYAPDVFGGTRRAVEQGDAQADVARAQRDAARLTLVSNLVLAAINEASLHAQLDLQRSLTDSARQQMDAVRKQQQAGQLGAADVAAQEALLAQAEAGLPPLEKQLAQQRNLLAVLTGRLPGDDDGNGAAHRSSKADAIREGAGDHGGSPEHGAGREAGGEARHAVDGGHAALRLDFASLRLPEQLPLSLPARLVEQRPDIRAAEAQLHAASAAIGIAQAARLPDISLNATLGSSALTTGTLFNAGTGFWSIGANLVQPLFHGGALMHQQRAAEASYEQSAAQYRCTVLTAFQNVADTLHAIDADARGLRASANAEQAAARSLAIAQRQWQLGAVGHPAVLQAEQAYRQAVMGLAQAQTARYADTVALFQALGGGWAE
ncbi:efflux transporter outer membrane subunit [Duganella sp. FT80W]|uniref:Efflux transporter outer membrane subunit n=1 Tax=Duganella guangzhouensis TaxID=2666084 RepID=A0A6I2L621_9BURK|nr:efflux transporter outer membrane subunit [Duganella guangzhouensis]MRW93621.1 efflux transporter outer membrane subunit [Duganella guangzhouensis]